MKTNVRDFRRQQTPAEQALWELLRDRRLDGLKFRRQFPIAIFIADFCCFELKLVIEVDGGVHELPYQKAHDENRDTYLRSLGYTILRLPNEQILTDPATVMRRIRNEAQRIQSPP
ncbi:MAG TPA: endonuclease domain-containing protein [Thermoanaerobaculia bacterium]|nr:endonuclease domain-containing protein [Thermoanaerobaculia bacterium]